MALAGPAECRTRPAPRGCASSVVGRGVQHSVAMTRLPTLADRLEAAAAELSTLRTRIEAGEPWPLTEHYGPGPESAWGPREVLAHCAEMLPYWLGEIERILDGAGDAPVPFGRTEDDPLRVGVIGRDRTMPARELLSRIESEARRVAGRIRSLEEGQGDRAGEHATRGRITVRELVERFQAAHLEGHVEQLREILAESGR